MLAGAIGIPSPCGTPLLPEVPCLMPGAFIRQKASIRACRFSFSALLIARRDPTARRTVFGAEISGLIMADNGATQGGSSRLKPARIQISKHSRANTRGLSLDPFDEDVGGRPYDAL